MESEDYSEQQTSTSAQQHASASSPGKQVALKQAMSVKKLLPVVIQKLNQYDLGDEKLAVSGAYFPYTEITGIKVHFGCLIGRQEYLSSLIGKNKTISAIEADLVDILGESDAVTQVINW